MKINKNINSIKTIGPKGIIFRSRLEARWADFFTVLGFDWDYEPFDLNGYIPDFIIRLPDDINSEILVEVKGITDFKKIITYKDKIEKSGWKGHYLIVGSKIWHINDLEKYKNYETLKNIFDVNVFCKSTTVIGILGLATPKFLNNDEIYDDGYYHLDLIKNIGNSKELYIAKDCINNRIIKISKNSEEIIENISTRIHFIEGIKDKYINISVKLLNLEIDVKWENTICSIIPDENINKNTLYFFLDMWEYNFKYLDFIIKPPGYNFNDENYKYHDKIINLWIQIQNKYQYKNKITE